MIFRSTLAAVLLCAASAFAQTTQTSTGANSPNIAGVGVVTIVNGHVTVKSSPAEDALVKAAKEFTDASEALNTMRQQAITTLTQNQKTLQDQITAAQKALDEKLKADKKYKADFDNIKALQDKLNEVSQKANTDFGTQAAPLMQKVNTDRPLIDGLKKVVRSENNLPPEADFDEKKGTWSVPEAKK